MSSLMEQVVVDADKLRAAAMRNAENTILEKYSKDIKGALSTILEQAPPMPGMEEEMPMPPEALMAPPGPMPPGPDLAAEADIPLAATGGEKLCPCPDEQEQIPVTINLDDLIDVADMIKADEGPVSPEMMAGPPMDPMMMEEPPPDPEMMMESSIIDLSELLGENKPALPQTQAEYDAWDQQKKTAAKEAYPFPASEEKMLGDEVYYKDYGTGLFSGKERAEKGSDVEEIDFWSGDTFNRALERGAAYAIPTGLAGAAGGGTLSFGTLTAPAWAIGAGVGFLGGVADELIKTGIADWKHDKSAWDDAQAQRAEQTTAAKQARGYGYNESLDRAQALNEYDTDADADDDSAGFWDTDADPSQYYAAAGATDTATPPVTMSGPSTYYAAATPTTTTTTPTTTTRAASTTTSGPTQDPTTGRWGSGDTPEINPSDYTDAETGDFTSQLGFEPYTSSWLKEKNLVQRQMATDILDKGGPDAWKALGRLRTLEAEYKTIPQYTKADKNIARQKVKSSRGAQRIASRKIRQQGREERGQQRKNLRAMSPETYAGVAGGPNLGRLPENIQEGNDNMIDITEEQLNSIIEELIVDMSPDTVRSGWAGLPESEKDYAEELELARRASTEEKEKQEAIQDAVKDLSEKNDRLTKYSEELSSVAKQLKEKLEDVSLQNAKLFYINRTLGDASLNGRQKDKIAESIQSAVSVEEAKVIYETLQSAVPNSPRERRGKNTLSEAISRPSAILPRRKSGASDREMVFRDRMKILAGIDKN